MSDHDRRARHPLRAALAAHAAAEAAAQTAPPPRPAMAVAEPV